MDKELKVVYNSLHSLAAAVMFAIDNNDSDGVIYAFKTKNIDKLFLKHAPALLFSAYRTDNLKIAKILIDQGVKLDVTNLLHVHVNANNIITYIEHLDSISSLISNADYEQGVGIFQALAAFPVLSYKELLCFNKSQVLLSRSFNNNLDYNSDLIQVYQKIEALTLTSTITDQILTTVAIDIIQTNNISPLFVVPKIKNAARIASYNPGEEQKIIYMPFYKYDSNEQSIFLHELAHYSIDVLFKNYLLPYSNIKQQTDYHDAIVSLISNVIQMINSPASAELIKEKIKLKSNDIYNIKEYLHEETTLSLFLYPSHGHLSSYIEDAYRQYYLFKKGFKATNPTFQDKQDFIKLFYNKTCIHYGLSNSDKLLVGRVAEALLRPERGLEEELIVVAAEFEIEAIDKSTMQQLHSLTEYWSTHISTIVEKMRSEISLPDCEVNTITLLGNNNEPDL
jgi:hypothetical protein